MGASAAASLLLDENLLEWEIKRGLRVPLGRPGTFGTVFKAKYAGEPVAVKQVDISLLGDTITQQEERFIREVSIHHKLKHKHAVLLLGALVLQGDDEIGKQYYIVMEQLRGSLHALVLNKEGLLHAAPAKERVRWVRECAQALRFMHTQGIIHADLKPENILLDFEGEDLASLPIAKAKIADFGLSRIQHEGTLLAQSTAIGRRGSALYMDPALHDDVTAISRSSDIYSFAILAWQLITVQTPFEDVLKRISTMNAFEAAVRDGARPPISALAPLLPPAVVGDVSSLLEACWDGDRARRPTAEHVEQTLRSVLDAWDATPLLPSESVVRPTAATRPESIPLRAHRFRGLQDMLLKGHSKGVPALVMLPDGRLASGDGIGVVKVWNVRTGACETTWEGHKEGVKGFIIAPEGRLVSYSKNGTIVAWNVLDSSCEVIRKDMGSLRSVVALPDGRYAACSHYDERAGSNMSTFVWKEKDDPHTLLKGHTKDVNCLAVLPDGNLVSGSDDHTIRVWNPATGECIRIISTTTSANLLAVLSDGRVAASSLWSSAFEVWDVTTGTCVRAIRVGSGLWSLLALPDGRLLCGTIEGVVTVWDVATGECEMSIQAHSSFVSSLAALSDGRLASGSDDTTIAIFS